MCLKSCLLGLWYGMNSVLGMDDILKEDVRLTYAEAQKLYGDDDDCSVFWGDIPASFSKKDVFEYCSSFGNVCFVFLSFFYLFLS